MSVAPDLYGGQSKEGSKETQINSIRVHLSREERLTGTAGRVKRLSENFGETFLVIMGGPLTDANPSKIVAFHKENVALAIIALKRI